jgi:hypothetical protein
MLLNGVLSGCLRRHAGLSTARSINALKSFRVHPLLRTNALHKEHWTTTESGAYYGNHTFECQILGSKKSEP